MSRVILDTEQIISGFYLNSLDTRVKSPTQTQTHTLSSSELALCGNQH